MTTAIDSKTEPEFIQELIELPSNDIWIEQDEEEENRADLEVY